MKRTPLQRKTPLRNRRPMARKTAVRRRNHARLRARRAAQFGAQAALCRSMPCVVCWATPCDPHHVKSRGAGGLDRDCVALCREHHDEFHCVGLREFNRRHHLDLTAEAARLAARLEDIAQKAEQP